MVNEIIPEHPAYQAEYLEAAQTWRLPFWDWAKNPRVPRLVRRPTFTIRIGDDPPVTIDNPLHQFKMPNDKKMGAYGVGMLKNPDADEFLDYGNCYATSRCPTDNERKAGSQGWREGVVHDEEVDKFLTTYSSVTGLDYGTAAELVYRLLTYPMDYPHFATLARDENAFSAGASTKVTNDINMEFIHNNVHYWVGGNGGHMSQIPVATFDPVFWLHHCNIDRLFAIWQTLNPDKWFKSDIQRYFDQKIVGSGDVITDQTPLRPFHKDEDGTVWMPNDTRDWFKMGYTYPELSGKETSTDLIKMVNNAYGISRKEALQMARTATELPKGVEIIDINGKIGEEGGVKVNDYALSIQYSKFALYGHPFNVEVYLRPEGDTENTFRTEDFVTNVFNFSQPSEQDGKEVCTNCKEGQARDVQVTAYIPVTSYLIKMFQQHQLSDIEPPTVEKVLARMYWRITNIMVYTNDATIILDFPDPQVIPSLGIGVTPAGVVANKIGIARITKLGETVSMGDSIIFKSSSMNLAIPRHETGTGIALLHWDPASTTNQHDVENYDILLGVLIKNKRRVIQCNNKPVNGGYSVTMELKANPWFGTRPQLKVDIEENQFIITVDGNKVGVVGRSIKKSVTHVRYYTTPPSAQPVMARELIATTYKGKDRACCLL
ncbi:hypothetical protein SLS62_010970 [Diatrype stigma]|uniref:tyrosinase n=1 Tax=Diatrype stigma TaxID=117547 RepID=A0AAN9YEV1_9PEZI